MNIIQLTPSITGSRPPIQSWSSATPPSGYAAVASDCDTSAMQTHKGHVDLTIEDGVVTAITGNDEAYQAYLTSVAPDHEVELAEAKAARIQKSKADLESYLEAHPITWTDGNQYSITREKQQQLSGKMAAAQAAQILSQPYTMEWNDTGMVCREWSMEDIAALGLAIDARITALVKYQQTQEMAMQAATSMDELNAIEVDYDTVQ